MDQKYEFSPVEIRHKEFSNGMFGYSKKEVREYLDMISAHIEDLFSQKASSDEPARMNVFDDRAQSQLVLEQLQKKEELISRTLIQAENTKNEILRNAQKEADNIVRSAELAAKKAIDDTKHYLNVLKHEFINMKEQKRQFLLETSAQLQMFSKRIEQDPLFDRSREAELDTQINVASTIKMETLNGRNDTENS